MLEPWRENMPQWFSLFNNIFPDQHETEGLEEDFTRIILKDESIHCLNATTDLGPEEKSGRQVDKGR